MNSKLKEPKGMKIVDICITRTVSTQIWVRNDETAKESARLYADEAFRCGNYTEETSIDDLVPVGESAGARLSRDSDVAEVAR